MTIRPFTEYFLILSMSTCLACSDATTGNLSEKQARSKESRPVQSVPVSKPPEIRFKTKLMGDGLTADGSRTYFTKYESSSGKTLYESWIYFASPSQAAKKMRDLLENPVKALRQNPEIDNNGREVGERILVLRRDEAQEGTQAILAWTEGTKYQEVRSGSLEDVLAFEKQFRQPSKQAD